MNTSTKCVLTAAVLLCALPAARPAAAQNTVTAQFLPQSPADVTALTLTPGTVAISGSPDHFQFAFAGALLNTGTGETFLNAGSLDFTGSGFDQDGLPLAAFPASLAPQTGSSGLLFTLTASGLVSPGTYYGSLLIQGGSDASTYDTLAVQPFEIQVTAPAAVPEASPIVSLGLLLALGGIGFRQIKRRAAL